MQIEFDSRPQLTEREFSRHVNDQLARLVDNFERLMGHKLKGMLVLYPAGEYPADSATIAMHGMVVDDLTALTDALESVVESGLGV